MKSIGRESLYFAYFEEEKKQETIVLL